MGVLTKDLSSSMLRLAMRTLHSVQVDRAGTVFRIITWVRLIPVKLSWVHEETISHRLVSSSNIKINRWSAVSSKIRYLPLRKEFLQLRMPRVSLSCSLRVDLWGHRLIINNSHRSCLLWAIRTKVLVALVTSRQRPQEIRSSQSKIIITSSVLVPIFIRRLISLDLEVQTTCQQPKATHLLSQTRYTKLKAINKSVKSTSMANFKFLAKSASVRNS